HLGADGAHRPGQTHPTDRYSKLSRGTRDRLRIGVRRLADRCRADRPVVHLLPTLFCPGDQHRSLEGMTRRIALCLLSLLFLAGGLMPMPATAQSTVQTVTIDADKAFFRPGEPATFTVTASDGARVLAVVTHLLDEVAQIEAPLQDGRASLRWDPPADAPRGYGLQARVLDAAGNEIAVASAAFDVLDHWLQAPRYGFLS